jgi:beta-carotene 3-hydroxylase
MLLWTALFVATLAGMEAFAHGVHKHVMHGPLWVLHQSHHERGNGRSGPGRWELNDVFALVFALPSVVLIYFGLRGYAILMPPGIAMAAYGLLNVGFHDLLVHRRIRHSWIPRGGYLGRIVQAHHIHHGTRTREGAESFGFFYAPDYGKRGPVRPLRAKPRDS